MHLLAKQFTAVARLTALETIRQPSALLLLTAAVVIMLLSPLVISHTLGESQKVVADTDLALHFLFGLLLGGYAACHSLSGEIRRGTAASVLSKPVSRATFYLAKFTGVAAVLFLFSTAAAGAAILSARTVAESFVTDWWAALPLLCALLAAYVTAGLVNYLTRRPFISNAFVLLLACLAAAFVVSGFVDRAGHLVPFGSAFAWRLVPAHFLVAMAVLILAAVALALATRLQLVPTVSICTLLFLVGLMSDYLLGRHAETNHWAAAAYALLPDWQHFWMADTLHLKEAVPPRYLGQAVLYAWLYLIGTLCLGIVSFRHTEVKS